MIGTDDVLMNFCGDQLFVERFAGAEVVDAPADVAGSGLMTRRPPRVLVGAVVEVAEGIGEA